MSILGIDPSLAGTGLATPTRTLTIKTLPAQADRLDRIYCAVRDELHAGDVAVIEDLPKHAHGAGLTGMAQGAVRLALLHAGVPFYVVVASSLKKFATGKGTADKHAMRMAAYKRGDVEFADDNQCDAWWLRQMGLHLTDDPAKLSLPAVNLESLAKVQDPA